MIRFFVGQRVRVVYPDAGSRDRNLPAGAEGVIVEPGETVDWRVRFPGYSNKFRRGGDVSPMMENELEPILGQRHEACDDEFKRDLDKLLEGLPA